MSEGKSIGFTVIRMLITLFHILELVLIITLAIQVFIYWLLNFLYNFVERSGSSNISRLELITDDSSSCHGSSISRYDHFT